MHFLKQNILEKGKKSGKLNNLKELLSESGVSARLLALFLNVHKGTITNWNTNATQPNLSDVDKIADLLEVKNQQVVVSKMRKKTGLAGAVVNEYKRIMKDGEVPLYINTTDAKGNPKKVFNPELVKKIQDFVEKYKKEHRGK